MVQVMSLRREGRRLPGAAIAMLLDCVWIFVFDPISGSLPHHGGGELLSEYEVTALLLLFFSEYLLTGRLSMRARRTDESNRIRGR